MEQTSENPVPIRSSNIQLLKNLKKANDAWEIHSNVLYGSSDASLFSSSLPGLRRDKLNFANALGGVQSTVDASFNSKKPSKDVEGKVSVDDLNLQGTGLLLPDDEEALLSGIMNDFDLSGLPSQVDELEEYDLFGSLGGMELDSDSTESITVGIAKASISDGFLGNGTNQHSLHNGVGPISGEHPYGEHPSRTLFVRNINSNVEDSELLSLFEQYGAIRSLYTACKHRGFVMISYYDIRSARTAMRALQNKPLRRRKLDIHFSIPKDNPTEKDMNQGTLVIFNLDSSVSNDDLRQIFGAYGEVKEIRETPHKRHHKFIEFYDVRAAEAALRSLNMSDIAGKRIKLEPSRPGGARRNLMQQLTHELEQDESGAYWHHGGSPVTNSPPGPWAHYSANDNSPLQVLSKSPSGLASSPIGSNHLTASGSVLPSMISSAKIAPIGKDQNRVNHADHVISSSSLLHRGYQHSHSFPDHSCGMVTTAPGNLTSFGPTTTKSSGVGTLTGPQFLWGNSTSYMEKPESFTRQSGATGISFMSNGQGQGKGFLYSSYHGSFMGSSHNQHPHHVGSAPSVVPFESQYGYFPESPEISLMNKFAFGNIRSNGNDGTSVMNMTPLFTVNQGILSGSMPANNATNMRMMPAPRFGPTLFGNAPYPGLSSVGIDSLVDQYRSRQVENHWNLTYNKQQYQLDLDKIIKGEDTRTTIMIKNIPNKYTSKMLLAAIDESHKGTYDFLYLPIDFKNKCNVGYAFINMVSPSPIISFYKAFNGKKWEKFNSEKVASLAYARIQGRSALVTHFQNSSLMNEDKRCRPILFYFEGAEAGDQEHVPSSSMHGQEVLVVNSPESLQ
ncbi:protein MEI2-like 2 isoform X1 [Musa acuminata AAA Group]|uniref:protein MEI2-like 2 isoform X1 n=2 Tax=Musa acuminata AAA Group TaxID=214697 RepID=UPI0031D8AF27